MDKGIKKRKSELKKKILTLEWDKKRHQLNIALKKKLENYKKELQIIENNLIENNEKIQEKKQGKRT
ncbi:hypothetical protein JXB41_05995 [Candidatus Woesearchaeota archaeon]|nr:hypothetical protein [Candidatus Woesearchaeota archaeon]